LRTTVSARAPTLAADARERGEYFDANDYLRSMRAYGAHHELVDRAYIDLLSRDS
jgi:hypothetical protein